MGPGMMGNDWLGWGLGPFSMIIFWILVIVVIVILINWSAGQVKGTDESALEILKKRYAKGEIGKEEFEAKKKDLL